MAATLYAVVPISPNPWASPVVHDYDSAHLFLTGGPISVVEDVPASVLALLELDQWYCIILASNGSEQLCFQKPSE
jgi:hypothetical protein